MLIQNVALGLWEITVTTNGEMFAYVVCLLAVNTIEFKKKFSPQIDKQQQYYLIAWG